MHAARREIRRLRDSLLQQYVCGLVPVEVAAFQKYRTGAKVQQCMASFAVAADPRLRTSRSQEPVPI
jgi:hypothetical protein